MFVNQIKLLFIPTIISLMLFGLYASAAANDAMINTGGPGLDVTAKNAGIPVPTEPVEGQGENRPTIPIVIGTILGIVLQLLGSLFLFLIVFGGFMWMTAGGNESQVTKAKTILTSSVIGLMIIVFSYAIVTMVFSGGGKIFSTTG